MPSKYSEKDWGSDLVIVYHTEGEAKTNIGGENIEIYHLSYFKSVQPIFSCPNPTATDTTYFISFLIVNSISTAHFIRKHAGGRGISRTRPFIAFFRSSCVPQWRMVLPAFSFPLSWFLSL
jgi:hypothetical protein